MDLRTYHTLVMLVTVLSLSPEGLCRDLTLEPGHLKPFGEGRPSQPVPEVDGFLASDVFVKDHAMPLRPIKMKGAAMLFPAFHKWTDDYFLDADEPSDHRVSVETKKKESRDQNMLEMSFKEFVKIYNTSTYYMVNKVPEFISHDVILPCSLQCKFITEKRLADNVMWFSSGGTNSVVHTDSYDNMNCLLRGNKTLVMVDPSLYKDKVDIDHPEGAYSDVNVDSVDYLKYPGLADVEFYHVNLTAGDCLYIPYKWIHQVRSFDSNLAVNVWWNHYFMDDVNYDECNKECDHTKTLNNANFNDQDEANTMPPEEVRDHFASLISLSIPLDFERFVGKLLRGFTVGDIDRTPTMKTALSQIFSLVDMDKDGILTRDEIMETDDKTYEEVWNILVYVENADTEEVNPEGQEDEELAWGGLYDAEEGEEQYPPEADERNVAGENVKHDEF